MATFINPAAVSVTFNGPQVLDSFRITLFVPGTTTISATIDVPAPAPDAGTNNRYTLPLAGLDALIPQTIAGEALSVAGISAGVVGPSVAASDNVTVAVAPAGPADVALIQTL
jgi:hypothetical protein